jgi:Fic family protein
LDLDLLARSPIGQLVPITGQDARFGDFAYFAFLPDDLPDDVTLSSASWSTVASATAALAKLDQACMQLPDPRLLIRPTLWREALDTNALEGTVGGLQELLEAQLPSAQYLSPETLEIRGYYRMALRAFVDVDERPISVSMLCDYQREMLAEAREKPRDLGRLRQDHVWIGSRSRAIQESRFVPAPGDDRLIAGLDAWTDWLQREHPHLPPVLRAALAHYQFETLHPFGDGNGRIGRLVVLLQLLIAGAVQYPSVAISSALLKRREEYQRLLLHVSQTGDWDSWVSFFCQAVSEQCAAVIPVTEKLVMWLSESREKLHERRWTGAIHRLLGDLIEWPVTTIADAAERYGVTTMNATRMIKHLEEIGVLSELTGKSYGRMFGATFVMDTVEGIR